MSVSCIIASSNSSTRSPLAVQVNTAIEEYPRGSSVRETQDIINRIPHPTTPLVRGDSASLLSVFFGVKVVLPLASSERNLHRQALRPPRVREKSLQNATRYQTLLRVSCPAAMSDEVSQFLESVERMRGQQIEEDEVRARELEEYLAAKRERQARREGMIYSRGQGG